MKRKEPTMDPVTVTFLMIGLIGVLLGGVIAG